MIVSLDSFDCKKGHQIKNVVFSIIINSNSEASMNHKIMKKRNSQGLWPLLLCQTRQKKSIRTEAK